MHKFNILISIASTKTKPYNIYTKLYIQFNIYHKLKHTILTRK